MSLSICPGLRLRLATTILLGATIHSAPLGAQAESSASERRADSLMRAREFAAALGAYEALAAGTPGRAEYWYQLGMAAASLKRYEAGAQAFGRAADITRGPQSSYNAGAMHARLGHPDSAFAWLARAVRSGFSDASMLRADEDLASLRGSPAFDSLVYSATHAPTPCADAPERRRFDFWLGEWDVTAPDGRPAGTSSIQPVSGGCALLENWTDTRGSAGKSLTTFNPAVGQWQQYWIGQDGNPVEYRESAWAGSSLVLRARFAATPTAPAVVLRLTFTPLDSSTVRQHSVRSTDDGATWKELYDFTYHRRR
jgi:hypothetical protein